jgi:hypothetical protein
MKTPFDSTLGPLSANETSFATLSRKESRRVVLNLAEHDATLHVAGAKLAKGVDH